MRIHIYQRKPDQPMFVWCSYGFWDGQRIYDCPADIPEPVYEALEAVLPQPKDWKRWDEFYIAGPDGCTYGVCAALDD